MERRLMAASWLLLSFYALASAWLATARRLPALPAVAGDVVVVEHAAASRPAPVPLHRHATCSVVDSLRAAKASPTWTGAHGGQR